MMKYSEKVYSSVGMHVPLVDDIQVCAYRQVRPGAREGLRAYPQHGRASRASSSRYPG